MLFIDLRASHNICAEEATFWDNGNVLLRPSDFASRVRGMDLVLVTHGFNVNRSDGIKALTTWSDQCTVSRQGSIVVGVLWPGDSRFLPVLDYPVEGNEALKSGRLLAKTLNQWGTDAASISFVSHSLGARTVLEATKNLDRKVHCLILMAGAIEDDCLTKEYQTAADNAEKIYVLASKGDSVLQFAFPIGNPIGEIIMRGHPYFKTALGRAGPSQPIAADKRGGLWQIPKGWDYGHGEYLPKDGVIGKPFIPLPTKPIESDPVPRGSIDNGCGPAWSAGAVTTQLG